MSRWMECDLRGDPGSADERRFGGSGEVLHDTASRPTGDSARDNPSPMDIDTCTPAFPRENSFAILATMCELASCSACGEKGGWVVWLAS